MFPCSQAQAKQHILQPPFLHFRKRWDAMPQPILALIILVQKKHLISLPALRPHSLVPQKIRRRSRLCMCPLLGTGAVIWCLWLCPWFHDGPGFGLRRGWLARSFGYLKACSSTTLRKMLLARKFHGAQRPILTGAVFHSRKAIVFCDELNVSDWRQQGLPI